jgi:hypothetical protein
VLYDKDLADQPAFDLILGVASMKELGIVLDFNVKTITIDEIILPMRNIKNLSTSTIQKAWDQNNSLAHEPKSTDEATQRLIKIADAKYEKADLRAIASNCVHLNANHQNKLLTVLKEFESLFDGTLGIWKIKPVSFQVKEGAKPYHSRAYPVPKAYKETLMKEVNRLCEIGVLKWQASSEWASPSFIIPKKDGTIRTVSDFREVNKRLIRKPFPIPKISTVLQELEGFTFATALDLNMGYYNIDWILTHPKSVPLSFHGVNTPIRDYQWAYQVLPTFSKLKCLS